VSAPPPAAPGSLTASSSFRVVTLNWLNNSTSQAGVYIERAAGSTGSFSRVGQVGPGISTFSQKVSRGSYRYRVQSFSSTGTVSAYSNVATIRV
jgi:hypothetical protein